MVGCTAQEPPRVPGRAPGNRAACASAWAWNDAASSGTLWPKRTSNCTADTRTCSRNAFPRLHSNRNRFHHTPFSKTNSGPQDGNLLFMGLRSGDILCCDLRLKQHHTIFTLPQRSTCWITMMSDQNQLLAANYFGDVHFSGAKMLIFLNAKNTGEFVGFATEQGRTNVSGSEKLAFKNADCGFGGRDGCTGRWIY